MTPGPLFVNPTPGGGSSDTPYAAATYPGTDIAVGIGSVNLRQGTAGSAPLVVMDDVVVSSSNPEPATSMLAPLGPVRRRR